MNLSKDYEHDQRGVLLVGMGARASALRFMGLARAIYHSDCHFVLLVFRVNVTDTLQTFERCDSTLY
jgi:hypothetical protein